MFSGKKGKKEAEESTHLTETHMTEEEMDRARGFSKQVKKYIIRQGKKEMADGTGMIKESQ